VWVKFMSVEIGGDKREKRGGLHPSFAFLFLRAAPVLSAHSPSAVLPRASSQRGYATSESPLRPPLPR
jgi:hypothetical protein